MPVEIRRNSQGSRSRRSKKPSAAVVQQAIHAISTTAEPQDSVGKSSEEDSIGAPTSPAPNDATVAEQRSWDSGDVVALKISKADVQLSPRQLGNSPSQSLDSTVEILPSPNRLDSPTSPSPKSPSNKEDFPLPAIRPASLKQLYHVATRGDIILMGLGILCLMVAGGLMPLVYYFLGEAFGGVGAGGDINLEDFFRYSMGLLITAGSIAVARALGTICIDGLVAMRLVARYKNEYMRSIIRQDIGWYDVNRPLELAASVSTDMMIIQDALTTKSWQLAEHLARFLSSVGIAFWAQPAVAGIGLAMSPLFFVIFALFAKAQLAGQAALTAALNGATDVGIELLLAMRTVTSFGLQPLARERYNVMVTAARTVSVHKALKVGVLSPTFFSCVWLIQSALFLYGGSFVSNQQRDTSVDYTTPDGSNVCMPCAFDLEPIDLWNENRSLPCSMQSINGSDGNPLSIALVPFQIHCQSALSYGSEAGSRAILGVTSLQALYEQLSALGSQAPCEYTPGRVYTAITVMSTGFVYIAAAAIPAITLKKGKIACASVLKIIDRKPPIDSFAQDGQTLDALKGAITVQHVKFAYPARPDFPVCKDYSLVVPAGTSCALCGPSGSGKSTIIALLERFYDPLEGTIKLDGVELRSLNVKWLRQQLGLVGQEPVLFRGTVRENIERGNYGFNRLTTQEEVEAAAKQANAHDFIVGKLSDGYDTEVGLGGNRLSGGQKQKIAIARTLIRQPKVLLLDEATSALDNESEKQVQAAIDEIFEKQRMTSITIAHRLSTIRDSNKIAVVNGGVITEEGTYDELVARGGTFAELAAQQSMGMDEQRPQRHSAFSPGRRKFQMRRGSSETRTALQKLKMAGSAVLKDVQAERSERLGVDRARSAAIDPKSALRTHQAGWLNDVSRGMGAFGGNNVGSYGQDANERNMNRLKLMKMMKAQSAARDIAGHNRASMEEREAEATEAENPNDAPMMSVRVDDDFQEALGSHRRSAQSIAGSDVEVEVEAPKPTQTKVAKASAFGTFLRIRRLQLYGEHDCRLIYAGVFVGAMVQGAVWPLFAYFTVLAVSHMVLGFDPDEVWDGVVVSASCLIGLWAVMLCTGIIQEACVGAAAEHLNSRMRMYAFQKIIFKDTGFFDREENSAGELAEFLSIKVNMIQSVYSSTVSNVMRTGSIYSFSLLFLFLWTEWPLALLVAVEIPLVASATALKVRLGGQNAAAADQEAGSQASQGRSAGAIISEVLTSIRTISALCAEGSFTSSYTTSNLEAAARQGRSRIRLSPLEGLAAASQALSLAPAFYFAAWLASKGEMGALLPTPGDPLDGKCAGGLTSVEDTVVKVLFPLIVLLLAPQQMGLSLVALMETIPALYAAIDLFERLDTPANASPDSDAGQSPATCAGHIEVIDLKFAYPSRPNFKICRGYNLDIGAGQRVALCGPSGSGKSTIIALLERFYDPLEGTIKLDGVELRSLNVKWLRQQLGLVGQEPVLFRGTVRENIAHGLLAVRKATQEEVEAAAKQANAHDFIVGKLSDGYDTEVGLGGNRLSGGQKQKIAIARTLIRQPKVLLLDEATSALDNESEKQVQAAIDEIFEKQRMTSIAIAHRLSTIRDSNKIAVVSKGVIKEEGTHAELLALDGIYASLVRAQQGKQGSSS